MKIKPIKSITLLFFFGVVGWFVYQKSSNSNNNIQLTIPKLVVDDTKYKSRKDTTFKFSISIDSILKIRDSVQSAIFNKKQEDAFVMAMSSKTMSQPFDPNEFKHKTRHTFKVDSLNRLLYTIKLKDSTVYLPAANKYHFTEKVLFGLYDNYKSDTSAVKLIEKVCECKKPRKTYKFKF